MSTVAHPLGPIVRQVSRETVERAETCVVCDAPAGDDRPCPRVPRISIPLCSSCLTRHHHAEHLGARAMTLWTLAAPTWAVVVLMLGVFDDQWASAALAAAGLLALWIGRALDRRRRRPWPAMVLESDEQTVSFVVWPARESPDDPFRSSTHRTEQPRPAPTIDPPVCASSLAGFKIASSVALTFVLIVLLAPYLYPLVRLDNPTTRPCTVTVDGQTFELLGKDHVIVPMHVGRHTFDVARPHDRSTEQLELDVSAGMRHLLAVPEPHCYSTRSSVDSRLIPERTIFTTVRGPLRWVVYQGDISRARCPKSL